MRCKICGYVFDETKKTQTCEFCLESNCGMVRCPNCGYETIPESKADSPESKADSKLVNFLKKRFKSENK
jgi:rubredoxin